ncbi:sulfite oxidase [Kitasatospora sp. McL0602]|uniref:sulfite oxidase n=1 Tax=Kitasatospora sp. McL0602 TaxID=3439530 RepID=UPI003F88A356
MDELEYDRRRRRQWLAGTARAEGVERRTLLRMMAAAGVPALAQVLAPARAFASAPGSPVPGIVKPLPAEWFVPRGTNAEMRWDTFPPHTSQVPAERFFVRNHTSTPLIDADTWRLRLFGSGLPGSAVEFSLDQLRRMPAAGVTAIVECAGNGRSFYTSQQQQSVPGTPWTLGGVGSAHWRGVRLSELLHRAGLRPDAVDVLPTGLDPEYLTADGTNLGHVRRPLPIAKALHDTLVAYEMNGEPLLPDHGAPARLVVPGWVGVASIKWLGSLEVAAEPLYSPWNTDFYRLFGAAYPPGGSAPLAEQVVKSAFELARGAVLPQGRATRLEGRSWSGSGAVRKVEISTDGGASWRPAHLRDEPRADTWTRWSYDWRPEHPGPYELRARATDRRGNTQPDTAVLNREGYLFGAVVAHPVTVA